MACSWWENRVLSNFTSRAMAAAAFYASGDLSVGGELSGTAIPDVPAALGPSWGWRCSDGGSVQFYPAGRRPLLFYNAFYGDTMKCTNATIHDLFRKGVDDTIKMLASPRLSLDNVMAAVLPSGGEGKGVVTLADAKKLGHGWGTGKSTTFYDAGAGTKVARAAASAAETGGDRSGAERPSSSSLRG